MKDVILEDLYEMLSDAMDIRNYVIILRDSSEGDAKTMYRRISKNLDGAVGSLAGAVDELERYGD